MPQFLMLILEMVSQLGNYHTIEEVIFFYLCCMKSSSLESEIISSVWNFMATSDSSSMSHLTIL